MLFRSDRQPPQLTVAPLAALSATTAVNLALTASDLSGPLTLRLGGDIVGGGSWQPYSASPAVQLLAGEGLRTVTVEVRDTLDNIAGPITAWTLVDVSGPAVAIKIGRAHV